MAKACKESEYDSILVTRVFLPYVDDPVPYHFGYVNSVHDEIDTLIRKFKLPICPEKCTLDVIKPCGNSYTMDRQLSIEDYRNDLTSQETSVRLIHQGPDPDTPGQPSLDSMGIDPR